MELAHYLKSLLLNMPKIGDDFESRNLIKAKILKRAFECDKPDHSKEASLFSILDLVSNKTEDSYFTFPP